MGKLPAGVRIVGVCAVLVLGLANHTQAGARRFTYLYEATTAAPRSIESETWVTWKTSPREERRFQEVDFRQELELGITDRLQLAVYLADWSYLEDPGSNGHGFRYDASAVELIYNLSNPIIDPIGSALYGEVRAGPDLLELESRLILQKTLHRVVLGYNAILEAVWEGEELEERGGEFAQTVGVSFELSPAWMIGLEMLHEVELPDWAEAESSVLYAGPNLSYRRGNWWATVTSLAQVTNIASEVDFQTRVIFGFEF